MMTPAMFVSNVPWWVSLVFAILVWRGWQASSTRTVRFRTIFIAPAIFVGWGIFSLIVRAGAAPALGAVWFAAALLGGLLSIATVRVALQADHVHGTIRLPGSWWPMLRYLGIFVAKFVLTSWSAIQPALRGELAYWDIGVSGMSAGYFAGWLVRVVRAYRHASPMTALTELQP